MGVFHQGVHLAAWFQSAFTQYWHEILLRFVPAWGAFAILGFFDKISFYNTVAVVALLFSLVLILNQFWGKRNQNAAVKRVVNAIGMGGATLSWPLPLILSMVARTYWKPAPTNSP